jgi:hypothetical protein
MSSSRLESLAFSHCLKLVGFLSVLYGVPGSYSLPHTGEIKAVMMMRPVS